MLPSGGGAIFPAGSFVNQTDVLVTEDLSDAQRNVAGFPADGGTLLGATRIEVPGGVALAHDITVLIALAEPAATNMQFTIFRFNSATSMWETTEAGASALRGVSATAKVLEGNVVSFTAPTAGTTGLHTAYGVFSGYSTEVPASANHIPTVDLTASKSDPGVGEEITLTATGADVDAGDTLTFNWLAPGGTLGTPAQTGMVSTATWSATAAGTYVVSVSCSDGKGGVATDAVTILIGVANDAPVWTESGTPPAAIDGDVSAPVATQKIHFAAAATDANGDSLTVTWTDNTGATGNFTDAQFDAATGTATAYWSYGTVGTYTITATVDDGKGATDVANVDVTLAELPTDFDVVGYETCGACHTDKVTGWQTTNHSSAFERNLSDPSDHHAYRNEACYNCHAAGRWPVGSGGFIDVELTPQFMNIQCESCHGGGNPAGMGKGHKGIAWDPGKGYVLDASGVYVPNADGTYTLDAAYDGSDGYGCGLCHEGSRHGAFEEWNKSWHAQFEATEDDAGTTIVNHKLTGASCAKCHNGKEFVRVQIDGGDPEDVTPTLAEIPELRISCATCHDVHNAANEKQLRVGDTDMIPIPWSDTDNVPTMVNGGWGNICIHCHDGRRDRGDYDGQVTNGSGHFGPHGNPQGAMFFGLMGADLGGPTTYDSDHPHKSWNKDTCVTCHMYRRPYISSSEPALFGHEFNARIERCVTCHTNYTVDQATEFWAWVEDFQTNEIHARMAAFVAAWPAAWKDVSDPENPSLTSVESAVGAGDGPAKDDPTGNAYREALWNYELVLNDATHGVHNPTFSKDLLDKATARVLELNAAP